MADSKDPIRDIVDAVGADKMQARLEVSEFSIRAAKRSGVFPASWYSLVSQMCKEAGVECPMNAFNWKSPSSDAPSQEAS